MNALFDKHYKAIKECLSTARISGDKKRMILAHVYDMATDINKKAKEEKDKLTRDLEDAYKTRAKELVMPNKSFIEMLKIAIEEDETVRMTISDVVHSVVCCNLSVEKGYPNSEETVVTDVSWSDM